jgi:hypothetical protein
MYLPKRAARGATTPENNIMVSAIGAMAMPASKALNPSTDWK